MVLEYAPGGTLLEYINRNGGRLSEDSARWFFQQLIIGMDYCHRHVRLDSLHHIGFLYPHSAYVVGLGPCHDSAPFLCARPNE